MDEFTYVRHVNLKCLGGWAYWGAIPITRYIHGYTDL